MARRRVSVECPVCGGSGRALADLISCGNCNGRGFVTEEVVIPEQRDSSDAGVGCVLALLAFSVVFALVLAFAILRWLFELLSSPEGRSRLGKLVIVVFLALAAAGAIKLAIEPEFTLVELGLVNSSSIWIDGRFHEVIPRPYNYLIALLCLFPLVSLSWGQANHQWLTDALRCIGDFLTSVFSSLGQGWGFMEDMFGF